MAGREPGRRVADRYHLERRLGRGGAGEVWRATDTVLDREVALKILHRHLVGDDAAMDRFRREAVTAAGINHRNIVVIHDIGEDEEDVFLVMELIDGPTLSDLIHRDAPLDPRAVIAIGHQIATGLGAAHDMGLVHRDVKPANVLLTAGGTAKIADFGIAKALGGAQATLTQPGEVLGTASYLAPEQLRGDEVDARADVYALGLVVHESLTARRAFDGETVTEVAVARFSVPEIRPSDVQSDVPAELDELVARATNQEPSARFADGRAMAAAFGAMREGADHRAVLELVGAAGGRTASAGPSTEVLTPDRGTQRPSGDDPASTRAARRPDAAAPPSRRPARQEEADDRAAAWWRDPLYAVPAIVALAVVVFLVAQALGGGEGPDGDGGGGDGPQPLEVTGAADHDPLGNDGREHPEDVPNAHDGDPSTAWRTSRYNSADLGGLKDGVGIVFEVGGDRPVGEVRVTTSTPGITYELYALDSAPGGDPSGWGEPVATVEGADQEEAIDVDGSDASHWVVWITRLTGGGGRAEIAEVTFLPA